MSTNTALPEHNVTGIDYGSRGHLRYTGPLIDIHSHVMRTRPGDPKNAMPAPRGRERRLFVDAPWRQEAARRARAAGVRVIMVHVGDPDTWFRTVYADSKKYGTKPEQYVGLERMLQLFPGLTWIGAHMGGDV